MDLQHPRSSQLIAVGLELLLVVAKEASRGVEMEGLRRKTKAELRRGLQELRQEPPGSERINQWFAKS